MPLKKKKESRKMLNTYVIKNADGTWGLYWNESRIDTFTSLEQAKDCCDFYEVDYTID